MIYLDEAATTPVKREVLEAMWPYLTGGFGNPASHHELGEAAARAVEAARIQVAASLGARVSEITFTSGGTESNNAAIKGLAWANPRGKHIIVSSIEHPAVLEAARWLRRWDFDITELGVDHRGHVDPQALGAAIRPDTTLVSVQYANNEVGTVQPITRLSAIAAEYGVPFHTDAVQAAGSLNLDVGVLGVQAMSLSGHKVGTPKGIGVLYVNRRTPIEPLIHGGGQQNGRRSGTENVAGAVAMSTGLGLVDSDQSELSARRDKFVRAVVSSIAGAELTGHPSDRLPGNASFVFAGRSGESIILDLERRGIVSSSGSACAAGSDEPSHVLTAMGLSAELAQTAVRFTFGKHITDDDLGAVLDVLLEMAKP